MAESRLTKTRHGYEDYVYQPPRQPALWIAARLPTPQVIDRQTGISIRFLKQWDVVADSTPHTADVEALRLYTRSISKAAE